jgi:hypothetical protein
MSFIDEDTIIIDDGIIPMYLKESPLRKIRIIDTIMEVGWGNGYVGLSKWHPWYKIQYDDIPVDVHGGLTFGEFDDETGLWIIGFDTAHHKDNMTNCSFEYVKKETERLMIQCMGAKGVEIILRIIKINKIKKSLTNKC